MEVLRINEKHFIRDFENSNLTKVFRYGIFTDNAKVASVSPVDKTKVSSFRPISVLNIFL